MAANTNQVKALAAGLLFGVLYDVPVTATVTALAYLKEHGYGLTSWNITLKFVFVLIG